MSLKRNDSIKFHLNHNYSSLTKTRADFNNNKINHEKAIADLFDINANLMMIIQEMLKEE